MFAIILCVLVMAGLALIGCAYLLVLSQRVSDIDPFRRGPSYREVLYVYPFCRDIKKIYLKHKEDMTPK